MWHCPVQFTVSVYRLCVSRELIMATKNVETSDFDFRKDFYAFNPNSVFRQVHSLLQSEFSTDCSLMLFLSFSSSLSFVISPAAAYFFIVVFPLLLPSVFPKVRRKFNNLRNSRILPLLGYVEVPYAGNSNYSCF
jgi:hypothetical protein